MSTKRMRRRWRMDKGRRTRKERGCGGGCGGGGRDCGLGWEGKGGYYEGRREHQEDSQEGRGRRRRRDC